MNTEKSTPRKIDATIVGPSLQTAINEMDDLDAVYGDRDKPLRSNAAQLQDMVSILGDARLAITGDREQEYGNKQEMFELIAAKWGATLGMKLTPQTVAILMIDLKTCRAIASPNHRDSWMDMAGYAAIGGGLNGED